MTITALLFGLAACGGGKPAVDSATRDSCTKFHALSAEMEAAHGLPSTFTEELLVITVTARGAKTGAVRDAVAKLAADYGASKPIGQDGAAVSTACKNAGV